MATINTSFTTPSETSNNDQELFKNKKFDTICLFDVDGTITMPRQVSFKSIYFFNLFIYFS